MFSRAVGVQCAKPVVFTDFSLPESLTFGSRGLRQRSRGSRPTACPWQNSSGPRRMLPRSDAICPTLPVFTRQVGGGAATLRGTAQDEVAGEIRKKSRCSAATVDPRAVNDHLGLLVGAEALGEDQRQFFELRSVADQGAPCLRQGTRAVDGQ